MVPWRTCYDYQSCPGGVFRILATRVETGPQARLELASSLNGAETAAPTLSGNDGKNIDHRKVRN